MRSGWLALLSLFQIGQAPTIRRLSLEMEAHPHALRSTRALIRAWAGVVSLPQARLERLLLASGEALSNAVEHAYPGGRGGGVDLSVVLSREGTVTVQVVDRGRWRTDAGQPEGPQPEATGQLMPALRGRGIGLMRAVMDIVDIRSGDTGSAVTLTEFCNDRSDQDRATDAHTPDQGGLDAPDTGAGLTSP